MKKALSIILALIMVFSTIPFAYAAESETSGQCGDNAYWYYDETTKTLYITGEGPMWDYEKNNTLFCDFGYEIEELNVESGITAIGDYTFSFLHGVTEIVLPETVKEIGEGAFFALTDTEMIYIPGSVKLIGAYAFGNCARLKAIILPRTAEAIGDHAFDGSDSVREIIFAEPVFVPGLDNFETMEYLQQSGRGNIIMGEGNEDFLNDRIVHLSFYECLYHPLIAPTCTTIGYTASIYCDECEGLVYGERVIPSISHNDSDFDGHCDSCGRSLPLAVKEGEPFTVKTHNEHYEVFYFTPEKTGTYVFSSDSTNSLFIELFDLSTGEYIRDNYDIYNQGNHITPFINHLEAGKTYYYRIDRLGADVPLDVTYSIFCYKEDGYKTSGQCGDNAYWNYDESTKTLYITGEGPIWSLEPKRIEERGKYNFHYDYYYEIIGYYDFKTDIEHIVIGDDITKIGNASFYGMSAVKDIHIGKSVEEIGIHAFGETLYLESIVIPGNVKKIGMYAFDTALGLKNVILEEGVETIEELAFNSLLFESIVIPSTVTEMDRSAFYVQTGEVNIINNSPTIVFGNATPEDDDFTFLTREFGEYYSFVLSLMINSEVNGIDLTMEEKFEMINEKFGYSFSNIGELQDYFEKNQFLAENTYPDNYVITCLPDSAQHEQCKELGIEHYFTDFTCDLECGIHASVSEYNYFAPTCTENGYEGGKVCTVCLANATTPEEEEAAILEAPTVIPATGHSLEKIEGIAPTCTKAGLTDGIYCMACNEIMSAQEEIPALSHTDINNDGICDNCGRDTGNTDVDHPSTPSFGERITNFFRGIVNAILELFKRLFG